MESSMGPEIRFWHFVIATLALVQVVVDHCKPSWAGVYTTEHKFIGGEKRK